MFDKAMAVRPDNPLVLMRASEFLMTRRWRGAARAMVDWLARLQPNAAPIEDRRTLLRRKRMSDAPALVRRLLSNFAGSFQPQGPRPAMSPAPEWLKSGPSPTRVPASPPMIQSWLRHAATLDSVPRRPVDVVIIGDSLARDWPSRLWDGRRVFNLGSAGDRTQHLLWRLGCFDDRSIAANVVVLMVGMNNLASGDEARAIAEGAQDVIAEIRRVVRGARVAALALPPFGPDFVFRENDRRTLNTELGRTRDISFIDEPTLWRPLGEDANCYLPDRIHFSAIGYRRLTEAVLRKINGAESFTSPSQPR